MDTTDSLTVGGAARSGFARLDQLDVDEALVRPLARALAVAPVRAVRARTEPLSLFPALGRAVDSSMPWQPPLIEEALSGLPVIQEALRPVAEAVLASDAAAWWSTDLDHDGQWVVRAVRDGQQQPMASPGPAAATLERWHENQRNEDAEYRTTRPVERSMSGAWWSTPYAFGGEDRDAAFLPSSTRRVGALGATGLALVEDGFGDEEAWTYRLTPDADARVYEVHGPDDWTALVARFPMDVRWARRREWWESTGREARWYIPDYRAAARDFDAIHLSVTGYLATAGRALDVLDGATVLAGWDPDATSWLTEAAVIADDPEHWRRVGDMHEWEQVPSEER
ncbi:hypothetical protein DEI93_05535 [Curtobacterium sp. MCBD17_035]|uniref:hypothetical protein n=1 Tax=Curtobacterium sp. MCBD17_035 TaxID=2175673 RepID=UPI0011B38AFE|nr:hypothetical protein [Curtobacterium sp. MCBD17_035]WIB68497.1 hypothetical protein DEI93_05535 [Curtobacterium sp. MCBD17_035]